MNKQKKVEEMLKKQRTKGITLIALVVTIVVLLILAGITITSVFGEGGILRRAQTAKEEYQKGEDLDKIGLGMLQSQIDQILSTENAATNPIQAIEKLGMQLEGVERITYEQTESGGIETYFFIAEKESNYYRTIIDENNNIIKVEAVNELTDEAVALLKYMMSDSEVQMISDIKFKYNGNIYNMVEENGDTYVIYVEKNTPIKILVNSGEDGVVVLPVDSYKVTSVNWGDGNITTADKTEKNVLNTTKLSSANSVKLAASWAPNDGPSHTYEEKNKEYEVEISGDITYIHSGSCSSESAAKKIIEIINWGNNAYERVSLEGCTNLRRIASPNQNCFSKITYFNYAFEGCTSLTQIPENLFANSPRVSNFINTFSGCTSLTQIPENLFTNCPNVTSFRGTFAGCTRLTGNAPKLWEIYSSCDGNGCFENCTGLSNYKEIPDDWKTGATES